MIEKTLCLFHLNTNEKVVFKHSKISIIKKYDELKSFRNAEEHLTKERQIKFHEMEERQTRL